MNTIVIVLVAGVLLLLLVFLFYANNKDRKKLERNLNQPEIKPSDHSTNEDPDDVKNA